MMNINTRDRILKHFSSFPKKKTQKKQGLVYHTNDFLKGGIYMKCQTLEFVKNKKIIISLPSAEFDQRGQRLKRNKRLPTTKR